MARFLAALAAVLLAACPQVDDAPEGTLRASPSTTGVASPSDSEGYVIEDVRLVRRDDAVADVVWAASFDATWQGDGPPERTKCRWRLLDDDELAMVVGAVYLEEAEIDDRVTDEVFPDEIAGVPRGAAVTC